MMKKTYEYKELNALYEIQILQNTHKHGISLEELAKHINKKKYNVYVNCYKYKKKGLLKFVGKKGEYKVIITQNGIKRIEWMRTNKGDFILKKF